MFIWNNLISLWDLRQTTTLTKSVVHDFVLTIHPYLNCTDYKTWIYNSTTYVSNSERISWIPSILVEIQHKTLWLWRFSNGGCFVTFVHDLYCYHLRNIYKNQCTMIGLYENDIYSRRDLQRLQLQLKNHQFYYLYIEFYVHSSSSKI